MIACVVAVSALAVVNRELILPRFREVLSRNAQDFAGEVPRPVRPQYDARTNVYLNGRLVYMSERRVHRPQFRLPPPLAVHGPSIVAEEAINVAADAQRPAGWLFKKVSQPSELAKCASVPFDGRPALLFPKDCPWLAADECFLASDVRINQLAESNFQRLASTAEMIAALRNPSSDYGPDLRVAAHSRFVQPLLEISLLFLGLPLVLGSSSRNIFVAIGLCGGVVASFFVVVLTCHGLGNNCLISPALAAWSPLAICVPIAVALCEPLRE
jgi:lipopolysaccharide export system permease protein